MSTCFDGLFAPTCCSTDKNLSSNLLFIKMEGDETAPLLQRRSSTSSSGGRRSRLVGVLLGQLLSLLLCVSALTSVYLTTLYSLEVPTLQNFLFYVLLSAVFTSLLACRPSPGNLVAVLRARGWRYLLLAFCDAEANFLVVKAYQYTTLTSVQLLDCFSIPTVLLLSRCLLRTRYRPLHLFGVLISVVGVGCLIWADRETGVPEGTASDRLLGDVLVLSGAFLYGVSNVAQELLVKSFDTHEFLGMIGLFGAVITGVQTCVFEWDHVTGAVVTSNTALLSIFGLLAAFALTQFVFYVLTAQLMLRSGATVYNLSILTADFYSLVVGILLFQYTFNLLYFVGFVMVLVGVALFSLKPTTTAYHPQVPPDATVINSGEGPTAAVV